MAPASHTLDTAHTGSVVALGDGRVGTVTRPFTLKV